MAVRTRVEIVDDLDETPEAETVLFGFDGVDYEIDLTAQNRTKLHEALEPYLRAGRKVKSRRKGRKPRPAAQPTPTSAGSDVQPDKTKPKPEKAKASKSEKTPRRLRSVDNAPTTEPELPDVDSKVVRSWAHSNGIEVPDRGRIPMKVLREYHQAQDAESSQAEAADG